MAKWVAVPISRAFQGALGQKGGLPPTARACQQRLHRLLRRLPVQLPALQLGGSHLGGSLNGRLVGILEGQQRLHVRQRLQLPVWSLKHRRLKLLYRTPLMEPDPPGAPPHHCLLRLPCLGKKLPCLGTHHSGHENPVPQAVRLLGQRSVASQGHLPGNGLQPFGEIPGGCRS